MIKLLFGLKVALIGIMVVFFVLIVLVVAIKALSTIIPLIEKWAGRNRAGVADSPLMPVASDEYQTDEYQTDEDEITAVISAAVAAYSRDR